jgi:hypothetical protein
MDSSRGQSVMQKSGGGVCFYFYALHRHWKDQRYCERDCNIVNTKWVKWLKFLKLYLSMDEWFHNSNDEIQVDNAKPLIGDVLQTLHALFQREDKTNDYCIPKLHGMTKFQPYMKRYGSAINFLWCTRISST